MVDIDKKYLKISEAAEICGIKEHILRYWEKHFTQLNPIKRNNHRYYQQKDIELLLRIKNLLLVEKFTLVGVKKILSDEDSGIEKKAKSNRKSNMSDSKPWNLEKKSEHQKIIEVNDEKEEIIKNLQAILKDLRD